MDITFVSSGETFEWDIEKAETNALKHGVSFEDAAEACLDKPRALLDAEEVNGRSAKRSSG